MQAGAGHDAGDNIVDHDAEATVYLLVQPADGPGLGDIENPKGNEASDYPGPAIGQRPHGNPVAHEFVPNDAAMVVNAQLFASFAADPDAENKGDDNGQGEITQR